YDLRRTHFDGVIDQGVVIGRCIHAEAVASRAARVATGLGQAGIDLPVAGMGWRAEVDKAGIVLTAFRAQEDAGAVQEGMGFVDMSAAYGQVPGIYRVFHFKRSRARLALPGVVV